MHNARPIDIGVRRCLGSYTATWHILVLHAYASLGNVDVCWPSLQARAALNAQMAAVAYLTNLKASSPGFSIARVLQHLSVPMKVPLLFPETAKHTRLAGAASPPVLIVICNS